MKEREKELVLNTDILCQTCFANDVKSKASVKCSECIRVMCNTCKDVHNKVPVYRGHTVEPLTVPKSDSELCNRHKQKVTLLCHACCTGLCVDCMFSKDHHGHQDQIEDFSSGIKNSKFKLDEQKTDLKHEISKLEKRIGHAKQNLSKIHSIQKDVGVKKTNYQTKIEEFDEILSDMTSNYEKPTEEAIMNLKNIMVVSQTALESVEPMESLQDFTFLSKLSLVKDKVDRTIKMAREAMNIKYPTPKLITSAEPMSDKPPVLQPQLQETVPLGAPTPTKRTPPLPPKKKAEEIRPMNTYQLRLITSVTTVDSSSFGRPADLVAFEDGSVLVADILRNFVVRVDISGNLLSRFYPKKSGIIRGISVFKDTLFIAGETDITSIPMSSTGSKKMNYWQLDVKCIGKIVALDEDRLLFTEITAGRVMEFNITNNTTTVKIDGLVQPDFISTQPTNFANYLISSYGKNEVYIYNQQWELQKTYRSFKVPSSAIMSSNGDILVSDRLNHSVSFTNMKSAGPPISILHKNKQGISYPVGLAYSHPYLWISQYSNPPMVKCFVLQN